MDIYSEYENKYYGGEMSRQEKDKEGITGKYYRLHLKCFHRDTDELDKMGTCVDVHKMYWTYSEPYNHTLLNIYDNKERMLQQHGNYKGISSALTAWDLLGKISRDGFISLHVQS